MLITQGRVVTWGKPSMVTAAMVARRRLMRDRQLLMLDADAITARSRELASAAWRRYHSQVPRD
jgi:hypothetical protein